MTTTPQPTPETDAKSFNREHNPQFVFSDFARRLERERNEARDQLKAMRDELEKVCQQRDAWAMRCDKLGITAMEEVIKEAHEALDWATSNMNPPFAWEPFKKANATLTKLQPFLP